MRNIIINITMAACAVGATFTLFLHSRTLGICLFLVSVAGLFLLPILADRLDRRDKELAQVEALLREWGAWKRAERELEKARGNSDGE